MTKDEIKAEIVKLEAEARQMLANSNFIAGAVTAFHKMLAALEMKEKTLVTDAATKVENVATEVKNEANSSNGSVNS